MIFKRNVTAYDQDPYKEIYLATPTVTVEFYKDRNYRSIFEIAVNVYHKGIQLLKNNNSSHVGDYLS